MPTLESPNLPALQLEKAIACKLSELKGVRVDRFSDSFKEGKASTGRVAQKKVLRIGHLASNFQTIDDGDRSGTLIERETAQYEIGIEVATLHNHDDALTLIGDAMTLVAGFKPYTNIGAIARVRYGDARFDSGRGIWEYVGLIQASLVWKNAFPPIIQLISELPTESVPIIRVWRGEDQDGKTLIKSIDPNPS